jgi:hypothetical protein
MPETCDEPPTNRELLEGFVLRVALPLLAVGLVAWNFFFFIASWALLPANDFGRMLASAELFARGQDMYAWTHATPARLEEMYVIDLHNMNPPHLHLLLLPFTFLANRDHAFIAWWALSAACLYVSLRWTLEELGVEMTPARRRVAVLLGLAFTGTTAMLFTAQLSFLLLVPITALWRAARRGRWTTAGALLGLVLSVKPFLGVVLAYLVWRRRWRAAGACLAVCAACYAAGLLVFGWDNHVSWAERLRESEDWAWLPLNASLTGALTRLFSESIWYLPAAELAPRTIWLLWLVVGGVLGLITLAATSSGDTPEAADQDLALLVLASILLCPLGWTYYLWLAGPPLLAVVLRGWPLGLDAGTTRRRWSRVLLAVMAVAFLWPPVLTRLFQPEWAGPQADPSVPLLGDGTPLQPAALATLTIGNVFFWGLLAAWGGLVWSGIVMKQTRNRFVLTPLEPDEYRVSVVMPVFSETDTVRQIAEWLIANIGPRLEEIVIVQSPRSSEASRAACARLVADHPRVRLHVQQENPGLGRGVREGFARVRGNVVLMIDSDGEMEIETVPRMLAALADGGHGLVSASRWLPGGGFSGYGGLKYYLNGCFQQLFRWLFWTPLTDLTYGFKMMRAELVRGIDWEGTLHEIACETTLKPVRLGVSVAEVPTRWTARTQGVSKNTFWRNFRYVRTALTILVRGVPFTPRPAPAGESPAARPAARPVPAPAATAS